jgi:hypothetical protein
MSKTFLASWDCHGLESLLDLDMIGGLEMWEVLKTTSEPRWPRTRPINQIVTSLMLRARANPQRNYEIYIFTVQAGITEDEITEMFNSSPQYSAELIRKRGTKVYSDRTDVNQRVIT